MAARREMGRGPAEFRRHFEWNNAPVYAKTIAEFADRLAEP